MMQKYELAESQIAKIDVQLKEAAALRKEAKKISDKLKNKALKYQSLIQEITDIVIPTEEELYQQAFEKAKEFKNIFPYFYMEMQYHGMPEERYVMERLYHILQENFRIPLIAANDAHMASKGE